MSTILLVEGPDDEEVLRHFLRPRGFEGLSQKPLMHPQFGELEIKRQGGYPRILSEFGVLVKSGATNVGIIVDRDVNLEQRPNPWPSLRARILKSVPELEGALPKEAGPLPPKGVLVPFGDGRQLGVWLMPDNESLGMLETWIKKLIPADDVLLIRAELAVNQIPDEHRLFGHKVDKACIHTWLAWQEEPGTRMGTAISNKYLKAEALEAQPFLGWLEALIAPPTS